jgi:hypothetical protein
MDKKIEQIVLLIHGIRTQADWQPMLTKILDEKGRTKIIPIKYGYFDAFRFWLPFKRHNPVDRVEKMIRVVRGKYPDARISVIAHSFGSYIIGHLLKEQVDLKLDKLILCGSILPNSYPWEEVIHKFLDTDNEETVSIVNECGKRDIWPVLAKSMSWGYGPSGTHGFGHVLVKDRFHNVSHSEYFNRDFVTTYWKPFLASGEYKSTEPDEQITPWWLSILGLLPLRWLLVAVIIGILLLLGLLLAPPKSEVTIEKLSIQFLGNVGVLMEELRGKFKDEHIPTPEIEDLKGKSEHVNLRSKVIFFHESDRKSAQRIREATMEFFKTKNCPISQIELSLRDPSTPPEKTQNGRLELWIHHNCGQN